MGDATATSATVRGDISKFYKMDLSAFEIHGIIVKSLPENRKFNTIKLFTVNRELIYLRPEGVSIPEIHRLLLRGPKVAICGCDHTAIIIGDNDWMWDMALDDLSFSHDGIQSIEVKDPLVPEACVEIICERIPKPVQAHFKIIFEDQFEDREISIVRGEIAAISNRNKNTTRLLRCFGDDLIKHLRPSENPEENLKRQKLVPLPLVSGEAIDLYRSHLVLQAESELVIDLNLELRLVSGTTRSTGFIAKATFQAPADPDFVRNKDFIPQAMEIKKKTVTLPIDELASIRVDVSWFNDQSAYVTNSTDFTLWAYRDGDCDYKGFGWADRQEINWDEDIKSE